MDQAAKGSLAISNGNFSAAVIEFTNAIAAKPEAVDYYIKRSTAYTRLSPPDFEAAYKDSEFAVVLANKRGRRELIAQAQLRRGIALFGLERYADAKQCVEWAKKMNPTEKTLAIWEVKVANKLKGKEEGDESLVVTVHETPDVVPPKPSKEQPKAKEVEKVSNKQTAKETPQPALQTPASKIRHDWFQANDSITVTLFAKGVPKDKATIHINDQSVEMSFPLSQGSDFDFSLDPLFGKIDPAASSYKIMGTKVEFYLQKAQPGLKWATLEGVASAPDANSTQEGDKMDAEVKKAVLSDGAGPRYPTSSRSGPKDWDKVADDLTKKVKKDDSEGEGEGGNEGGDDDDSDPVNGFFKKLYKDADPDTRRAMMKSYQESNGTALSTNWSEVGKGPVETSPPDGMEAKKW